MRRFSPLDRLLLEFDTALRALAGGAISRRPHPGRALPETPLSETERRHAASLMRINHAGEVCAQALYQGQALTAKTPALAASLSEAAHEESEHLAWTERRVRELGSHTSLLNPFWYAGSLALGALAGALGDRWNLGFLAETERQVDAHLAGHLERLPPQDARSRAILEQMRADEQKHAETAVQLGGVELPRLVPDLMRLVSRIMTKTAYRL